MQKRRKSLLIALLLICLAIFPCSCNSNPPSNVKDPQDQTDQTEGEAGGNANDSPEGNSGNGDPSDSTDEGGAGDNELPKVPLK